MHLTGSSTPMDDRQLIEEVATHLAGVPLLPPPTAVGLRIVRGRLGDQMNVVVASRAEVLATVGARDAFEIVEMTGCLHPAAGLLLVPDELGAFRAWSIAHPVHPLAVRYQLLAAWLAAGPCDARFFRLATQFVREERDRLEAELIAAARRLLLRREASLGSLRHRA